MPDKIHDHNFGKQRKMKIHIIVVSSSRTLDDDESGKSLMEHFKNHHVSISLCRETYSEIFKSIACSLDNDVIITTGGTGPSPRDVTVQTLTKISEKELRGFGELFRMKSSKDISFFSNASLFIIGNTQIYCLPGSVDSVKIGAEIIDKFMYHVFHELHKEKI